VKVKYITLGYRETVHMYCTYHEQFNDVMQYVKFSPEYSDVTPPKNHNTADWMMT
jgi:hypothetical protein